MVKFATERVNKDGIVVTRNPTTDDLRVEHDLCPHCELLENCLIAKQCHEFHVVYFLEFLITSCPRYFPKDEDK